MRLTRWVSSHSGRSRLQALLCTALVFLFTFPVLAQNSPEKPGGIPTVEAEALPAADRANNGGQSTASEATSSIAVASAPSATELPAREEGFDFIPPLSNRHALKLLSKLNKFGTAQKQYLPDPNSKARTKMIEAINSIYAYSLEKSTSAESQLASDWRLLDIAKINADTSRTVHEFSLERGSFFQNKSIRGLAFRVEGARVLILGVDGKTTGAGKWSKLPCENMFLIRDFPKRETCYFRESYFLDDLRISLISDQPESATLYCYALVAQEESPLLKGVFLLHEAREQAVGSDWDNALTSLKESEKALRAAWLSFPIKN